MATGEDVTITIGGTDYSKYIDSYSESGSEEQFMQIRTFGNNYETVSVGVNNYSVEFNFRVNSTTLKTLKENSTPVTIIIALGSETTITYNNMLPESLMYGVGPDDLATGVLIYQATAYTSGSNNRVLS